MPHILLVNTHYSDSFSSTRFEENLGLLYLEASLKMSGYEASIIDGMAYNLSYKNILKKILNNLPSVFTGFSAYADNIKNTINIVKDLRKEGYKGHITIGGMWASFKHREILEQVKEIDSVCVGEGEEVVIELSDSLSKGINPVNIKGLATRREDSKIVFTPRKFKDNIDDLPVPDRSGYYLDLIKKKGYVAIIFSRGCHGRCNFCNIASYITMCGGKSWRPRDPLTVIDEMEYLINTTGVKVFDFVDDNFFGINKKGRENIFLFAEELTKRKLNIKFSVASRVETVNYELLCRLKDAGLVEVTLGIESWVEEQNKRYNKKITLEEIWKAIEILDKTNLSYKCFLIPVDPYVRREEIIKNLDMMEKHRPEDHLITYKEFFWKIRLDPYLPLFKKCYKDNLIKNFSPEELDNYNIKYYQLNSDVNGIVEACDTVAELYQRILIKLNLAGRKMPPYQWYRIEKEILLAFKKMLYRYFRDYIDSRETEGGKEFIYQKTKRVYKNICSFIEKLKREDIMELKEYIIDIDGIKVSTRPEGFNEFISLIMERNRND